MLIPANTLPFGVNETTHFFHHLLYLNNVFLIMLNFRML